MPQEKRTEIIDQANLYSQVIPPLIFVMISIYMHMKRMKEVSVIHDIKYHCLQLSK